MAVAVGARALSSDPLLASVPEVEGYKVLGGVVLYQKLGHGGMGAVYRGRHLRLNIDVALKVMGLPATASPEQEEAFIRRFVREAQTAAGVKHRNLIRVYDVNSESGLYYLVMDYVDGESAGERLRRKRRLSEAEGLSICAEAADGLAEAHRKGIVHRDVKPDNILIDKDGTVVVADLGLAKAYGADGDSEQSMLTRTQSAMGTPSYMAPEQFTSARTVGPRADVWSLGVTLFHLLTGRLPWTAETVFGLAKRIESEAAPDPVSLRRDVSPGTCAILTRALQKDSDKRYADCAELSGALRDQLELPGRPGADLLRDPEAGSTRTLLAEAAIPSTKTMTLIARSFLAADGRGRIADAVPARRPGGAAAEVSISRLPTWLPVAVLGGVAFLAATIWMAAGLSRDGAPQPARVEVAMPVPVEADVSPRAPREEVRMRDADRPHDAEAPPQAAVAEKGSDVAAEVRVGVPLIPALDDIVLSPSVQPTETAPPSEDIDAEEAAAAPAETASAPADAPPRRAPAPALVGPLGIELVLIAGGGFRMGSDRGRSDERPPHEVNVSPFYIGRYEVTRRQYRAAGEQPPASAADEERLPVASVSWDEAVAFCRRLSSLDPSGAAYRLPTEAEWEFAARGPAARTYPWGEAPPSTVRGNLSGDEDGYASLAPVGSFPAGATPEGVADLIGNVAEWCADLYGPYAPAGAEGPAERLTGTDRVIRGSAFAYAAAAWSRASARGTAAAGERLDTVGFRVVRELTPDEVSGMGDRRDGR